MKHVKIFEQFVNEDKSKKNRFLGILGPSKNVFQRKIKKISTKEVDDLIKYTDSNGDHIEKVGKDAWGITKESNKDNQSVWHYDHSEGILYFENPNHPSVYDTYIRKELNESVNEAANDYTYKEDSGGGKKTWVLNLGPNSWNKVKHLFDEEGRPTQELTRIKGGNAVWSLYAQKKPIKNKEVYKIYGVSGDYSFGNAPNKQQRYSGNKRAAKKVYDWFIEKYLD
jgi:hypothetical protein